jgi:hypothetical protein
MMMVMVVMMMLKDYLFTRKINFVTKDVINLQFKKISTGSRRAAKQYYTSEGAVLQLCA